MAVLHDFFGHGVVINEQHAHIAANLVASGVVHQGAAVTVQSDVNFWAAAFGINTADRIDHPLTGDDALAFQRHRAALALFLFVIKIKGLTLSGRCGRVRLQPELQVGGFAQNHLGAGGILHPGQLHYNAVATLLLHQGFTYAQFVDAIAQCGQVFGDRMVFYLLYGLLCHSGLHRQTAAFTGAAAVQLRRFVAQHTDDGVLLLTVLNNNIKTHGYRLHFNAKQALIAYGLANRTLQVLHLIPHRFRGVHLQQEVHTAGQVQPQVHRCGAQLLQPFGCGGGAIERHHVTAVVCGVGPHQRLIHHRLGCQLVIQRIEPQQGAAVLR